MNAETRLHGILAGDAAVAAAVGERIFNKFVPTEVGGDATPFPAISYLRVGTEYVNTIHGSDVTRRVTLDIVCVSDSDGSAEDLCDLVAAIVPIPPAEMTKINRIAEYDSENGLHAAILTVDVWEP